MVSTLTAHSMLNNGAKRFFSKKSRKFVDLKRVMAIVKYHWKSRFLKNPEKEAEWFLLETEES